MQQFYFFNVSVRLHFRGVWKQKNMHGRMYVYIGRCVWLFLSMDVILSC